MDCAHENQSEASWDALVHHPILRLALAGRRVRSWNAYETLSPQKSFCIANMMIANPRKAASIIPDLVPRALYTNKPVHSHGVDFSITVEPSPEEGQAIMSVLLDHPREMRSISQTMYDPLRLWPSAIAVAGGVEDEAIIRLTVWTKAWMDRMATLGIYASNGTPPTPLLRVHGGVWFLDLAWEETDEERGLVKSGTSGVGPGSIGGKDLEGQQQKSALNFMTSLPTGAPIGNTTTLIGACELVAAIRRLADWAEGPFLTWFTDAGLGADKGL